MTFRFFISMCLFWALSSAAFASDPFALLFGDEVIETSESDTPNAKDISLLRFSIRDYLIDESWVAFETRRGLCLPVKSLTDALEFPLTYTETEVTGWLVNADEPFDLTFTEQSGFIQTDLGWCASAEVLEALIPVKIKYLTSDLTLRVEPTITLPMDGRIERLAARQLLGLEGPSVLPNYATVENEYQWLSWPILDLGFEMRSSNGQPLQITGNIEAAGDILKMSGRLRTVARQKNGFESARLTLFRESDLGDQLGPLKARRFAIGDVSAYTQPLLSRSAAGRGAVISNRPLFQPDQFDAVTLRGPLPTGWEAELYDDEILLAFVTEPDNNGDYVFKNIALRPGYNRLTIKCFGPHGEVETRVVSQFVGADMSPAQTLYYAAGVLESDQALFGMMGAETDDKTDKLKESADPYSFLSLNYGLSTRHSARLDLQSTGKDHLASLGFASSAFGGYGLARIATDGKGLPAVQGRYQRRLFKQSGFSLNGIDYGDLQTEFNGKGVNSIRRQIDLRFDSQFKLGRTLIPLQTEAHWLERRGNRQSLSLSSRLSGQLQGLRWSNNLRYFKNSGDKGQVQGEFLSSRLMGGGRLRAALGYNFQNGFDLENASVAFQRKIKRNSFFQTSASFDMSSHVTAFDGALSHNFDAFSLSVKSGFNSEGSWNLGVGLSMALYRDKSRGALSFARSGLSRSGVIAPHAFDDVNENGVFDRGDKAVAGVQYITDNSLRSETGNSWGVTRIAELPTGKAIQAEMKLSSIEDPFLYPAQIGRSMTLRPGTVLSYDVPLTSTGEAEGYIFMTKNDIQTPIAGVTIEARNASGHIISTTVSEYDGYFYFDKLPTTNLTIGASPKAIKAAGGTQTPMELQLSRANPTAVDIQLNIQT